MPKTNKSFTKRLRITRTGKIIARAAEGKYKARDSRNKQLGRKRNRVITLSAKIISRNMPHSHN